MKPDREKRLRGAAVGFAVGDALGAPVAFQSSAAIRKEHGYFGQMIGGGRFGLPPGSTTAISDLFLAVADSLVERNTLDLSDLARRLLAVVSAEPPGLNRDLAERLLTLPNPAPPVQGFPDGGCLIFTVPLALAGADTPDRMLKAVAALLGRTHPALSCRGSGATLARLVADALIDRWTDPPADLPILAENFDGELAERIRQAPSKNERDLRPSAHVVDILEIALWSLSRSQSFGEALVRCVNLGGDTTTTCAVVGACAGARWGVLGIPDKWLSRLASSDRFDAIGRALAGVALP